MKILFLTVLCFPAFAADSATEGGTASTGDLDVDVDSDDCPALSLMQRQARLTSVQHSKAEEANHEATEFLPPTEVHMMQNTISHSTADWGFRDALLLVQQATRLCDKEQCHKDKASIFAVLLILTVSIFLIFLAFFFFREDKEEQVTPLCPQLVVRDSSLTFKIALDPAAEKLEVLNAGDPKQVIAKVAMDWPDPFRPCASGIASTARLQNAAGMGLATVVARNVAVTGQALALCRSGCEIFGFVEPDSSTRYHVRHRTGVHLLTLVGDFSTWHVDGVNPAGAVVFSAKKEGDFCVGKVQQHVDAGLLICCVVAAHIHRVLQQPPHCVPSPAPPPYAAKQSPRLTPAKLEDTKSVTSGRSSPMQSGRAAGGSSAAVPPGLPNQAPGQNTSAPCQTLNPESNESGG